MGGVPSTILLCGVRLVRYTCLAYDDAEPWRYPRRNLSDNLRCARDTLMGITEELNFRLQRILEHLGDISEHLWSIARHLWRWAEETLILLIQGAILQLLILHEMHARVREAQGRVWRRLRTGSWE